MRQNILQVENLIKCYAPPFGRRADPVRVVNNVSFSIPKGAIMGLIGESGCGKTTIGRTLLNLTPPTGGRVLFEDEILFDVEKGISLTERQWQRIRKRMQIVFQDPYSALDPRQTIQETVAEGAIRHGLIMRRDSDAYAQHYLKICGISESALSKHPHEFSGGQRQRINIARSLAVQPDFLICDEVTAALDVSIQSQILNLLLDLRQTQGLTMLIISHNIDVVRYLCDFVAVMYFGRIVEVAEASMLYEHPLHPYTQTLLAAIPRREPWEPYKDPSLFKTTTPMSTILTGCQFYSRCPECMQACFDAVPTLQELEPNHFVACWNR